MDMLQSVQLYTKKTPHYFFISCPSLATIQVGSAEVEQLHLSNCSWHLSSSRAKIRFINVWAWLCSLCTPLLRPWKLLLHHLDLTSTSDLSEATKWREMFYRREREKGKGEGGRGKGMGEGGRGKGKGRREAKQTKDNCICVHFLK